MSEGVPSLSGQVWLAIDCADPKSLSEFWHGVLGGELEPDESGDVSLGVPGVIGIDFLRVPDRKVGKNRLHLDLRSTDFDKAVAEILALGATKADDVYDGDGWQVLRDPEGNEFCILRPQRA